MVTVPFLLTTNVYTPASRETPARAQSASVIFLCQTPSSFAGTADARVVAASTVASGHAIASANATTAQWVVLRADTRTPLTPEPTLRRWPPPTSTVGGRTVAGFAAIRDHLSYLPFSGSVLSELADELDGFTRTKSALPFAVDEPLPESLVEKLIAVRLAEER